MLKNYIVFILLLHVCIGYGHPIEISDKKYTMKHLEKKDKFENIRYERKETKKDVFLSRGWGAGGMPFSVLYMNPTYSSKQSNGHDSTQITIHNMTRGKSKNGNNRSTIPHLFVSYGWGPLGKK